MSLYFHAADLMNIALHRLKNGKVIGKEARQISFGPWTFDVLIDVHSDLQTGDKISFWMDIDHLKTWVLLSSNANKEKASAWVVVLDRDKMEKQKPTFDASDFKVRMEELKPFSRQVFQWKESEFWSRAGKAS